MRCVAFHDFGILLPLNSSRWYLPVPRLFLTLKGPSQFGLSLFSSALEVFFFSTKSPAFIALGTTLELYHMAAICLLASFFNLAISLASGSKSKCTNTLEEFSSWLKLVTRHDKFSISTGSTASAP